MMTCPHCGADHDPERSGRFCDNCGMSVLTYTPPEKPPPGEEELPQVRCRYCGVKSPPPVCLACGTQLPTPD